jgi:predicted PurR-regulated permease PerM
MSGTATGGAGGSRLELIRSVPRFPARVRSGVRSQGEARLEFLRGRRPYSLDIREAQPLGSITDFWNSAAEIAIIGIFVLVLVAALYVGRELLLPILAAMVIGTTLAPIVKFAARYGISPWITALFLTLLLIGLIGLAATLIAAPITEWVARAPEIGENIRHKLSVFNRPIAALRELYGTLMPSAPAPAIEPPNLGSVAPAVVLFVTPAVAQIVLFLATLLFFLAVQAKFRGYAVSVFAERDAKLRFLRIANDVEDNLASYVGVVTIINMALGVIAALGAWAFGFPNPWIFGVVAAIFNYLPYVGPACMVVVLFAVGLVVFPTLSYALLPPACFIVLSTIEGHVVTPAVLGQRLTLNPLAVLLALAFWTWLWGPMGAFLAVPLLIVALVIFNHLIPSDEPKLPE